MKWVCTVCGYVHEGPEAPEACPICKVPAEKFMAQGGEVEWADQHVVGVAKGVDEEIITLTSSLYVGLLKSKASTVDELKEYLSQNPITFQHQLITESVKTVDLSVVDQDGNSTKLSTFNDITHVTLSSEGLIPKAELEVATKNEEVLSTMSLEMNDISTTQNALQETSSIQSENVDSTMIATTEIYEELL